MDIPRVSATQISLEGECERKWGFRYLDGIRPEPTKGSLVGVEVQDEQIDPYLARGRPIDFSKRESGEIAQAILPLLPPAGSAREGGSVQIRRKFEMPSPDGSFDFVGELDLWARDGRVLPWLGSDGTPVIGDIKVTRDLRYAKTADVLATDVQAQLYAMSMLMQEDFEVFDLAWITGRRVKPYRSEPHWLRVGAAHILEQFKTRILPSGRRVARLWRERPKAAELKPNPRMCDAYGGCPYRHICNLSPAVFAAEAAKGEIVNNTNAFLASLRQQTQLPPGTPVAAPAPFAVPPATALPPWATSPVDPIHDQRKAIHAAHTPVPSYDGAIQPVMSHAPPAINPPESTLPPAPPVGAAAPAPAEEKKRPGRPAKVKEEGKTVAEATAAPGYEEAVAVVARYVPLMRTNGIKRLVLSGGPIMDLELFTPKELVGQ